MAKYNTSDYASQVIGNVSGADESAGFKSEVKAVFESYSAQGIDLIQDLGDLAFSPNSKSSFIDAMLESMTQSPLFTNPSCSNSNFYGNYADRVGQLLDNTLGTIATESVMTGYAPIVAYTPFFLKKQWIDCVFKDVLMTEIPKTPVINFGFEKRYLKDMEGNEYPLPEALYDDALVSTLIDASTGLNISSTPIALTATKNLNLIDPTYIPGVIAGDHTVELTPGIRITAAVLTDTTDAANPVDYTVPMNATVDVSTHNFVHGDVTYDVLNPDGTVLRTLSDTLVGKVDFVKGTITVVAAEGVATSIVLAGKTANRFNNRSLDVVRRVEKIEKTMPESGPRLNSAITVEEAADALALQKIDIIADNINVMGSTLANFEDAEIKQFLQASFAAQKAGSNAGIKYNDIGNNSMIVEGGYDTLPYEGYSIDFERWLAGSREYFERIVGELKLKLRSPDVIIVAIANPNLIRFLQKDINWVFSEDTQISGVKLSYNFGIYTSAQDRVHILTTMRMSESEGIRFVVIPLTQELITFKHYKYNVIIDRNYRHPMYSLVPNIMTTQRTLTFEITPVQGTMEISGRELFSPETLVRP